MRRPEDGAGQLLRRQRHICVLMQVQVDSVDVIGGVAVGVLQAQNHGIQRSIDDVIEVMGGESGDFPLSAELGPSDSDDTEPLLIDLYVLINGIGCAKKVRACSAPRTHTGAA